MNHSFNLKSQPDKSSQCGQTVIFMVTGRDFIEITDLAGSRRMYPRDIRKALEQFGWEMSKHNTCKLPDYPEVPAVLFGQKVEDHKMFGHWMLWTGGRIYDPQGGNIFQTLGKDWSGRFYEIKEKSAATAELRAENEQLKKDLQENEVTQCQTE